MLLMHNPILADKLNSVFLRVGYKFNEVFDSVFFWDIHICFSHLISMKI